MLRRAGEEAGSAEGEMAAGLAHEGTVEGTQRGWGPCVGFFLYKASRAEVRGSI